MDTEQSGKTAAEETKPNRGQVGQESTGAAESGTGRDSDTSTAGTGAGTGTGTGKPKRVRNRKKPAPEPMEAINGLTPIDIPINDPASVTEEAPKPKKRKTKKDTDAETAALISTVIGTGFEIVAARAGDHWRIAPEEADAITKPLIKIMDRLNITERVEKYGDWAALALAVGGVVVPRAMMTMMLEKEKKNDTQSAKITKPDTTAVERNKTASNAASDAPFIGAAIS